MVSACAGQDREHDGRALIRHLQTPHPSRDRRCQAALDPPPTPKIDFDWIKKRRAAGSLISIDQNRFRTGGYKPEPTARLADNAL